VVTVTARRSKAAPRSSSFALRELIRRPKGTPARITALSAVADSVHEMIGA